MSDIFLSYASEDRERIQPLVAALGVAGWSVFWDRTIPTGQTWWQVIPQEIRSCRAVVVVWSQQSVESFYVREEAEEGRRRGIRLLPVRVEEVDPPFGFTSIQAADFTRWDGSSRAPVFLGLVRDISKVPGMPKPAAAVTSPEEGVSRVKGQARRRPKEREGGERESGVARMSLRSVTGRDGPGKALAPLGELLSVEAAARILRDIGLYSGPVEQPERAALAEGLKEFQRSRGIPADGVLGPLTALKLGEAGTRPGPPGQMDMELFKKRAKAIVQIFESGRPRNYVFLEARGGDLEYGYLFASLKRGALHELIQAYCGDPAAKFSKDLRPYLERLAGKDLELLGDQRFHGLLRSAAGEDPVMIKTQDRMFDRAFWEPAVKAADAIGLRTPLGIASIYDTMIQSGIRSYLQLKEETIKATDGTPVTGIDEKEWVRVYLEKRLGWLRKNPNTAVRSTAYRAEELLKLVKEDNWELRAPLTIRGTQIRT